MESINIFFKANRIYAYILWKILGSAEILHFCSYESRINFSLFNTHFISLLLLSFIINKGDALSQRFFVMLKEKARGF
jgi:hypothetical protein